MESALVLALHHLADSRGWLANLVVVVAQFGVFLLPLTVAGVWFGSDPPDTPRREAILVGIVAVVLAYALGLVLERTLNRPRPFVELGFEPLLPHAADSSFPSDHTLVGAALVGPLLRRASKLGSLLLVWAVVVGTARMVAGLHYPSDIAGSVILALALDASVWVAMRPVLMRVNLNSWIPQRAG